MNTEFPPSRVYIELMTAYRIALFRRVLPRLKHHSGSAPPDLCGIGIVEVLWKTATGILNRRLMAEIQFHNTLHSLCTGRCTGIASLEANLIQQLMYMR